MRDLHEFTPKYMPPGHSCQKIAKRNDPQGASQLLERVMQSTRHTFWPDNLSLADTLFQADSPGAIWTHVIGHRQVTYAYLLSLARKHRGKLATLDQAIPSLIEV